MDTLFYDGQCPICRREMDLLQSRLRQPATLQLQDLHTASPEQGFPGKAELLANLHLLRDDGTWLTGLDANARAWSHTAWGWLFAITRWPLIKPLSDWIYEIWANRRYQRLYGCGDCAAQEEDR